MVKKITKTTITLPVYEGYMASKLYGNPVPDQFFKTEDEAKEYIKSMSGKVGRLLNWNIEHILDRKEELKKGDYPLTEKEINQLKQKKAIFEAIKRDHKIIHIGKLKKVI